MAILFYDHLISKSEVIEIVGSLDEEENQKGKALQLIDDIIFQSIIAHILEQLSPKQHDLFLTQVHERPYDPEIISFLRDHIGPDIEEEIRQAGNKVVKKIISDIQGK